MKINILILCALVVGGGVNAEDNVHFSGTLVSEPCTLPEADADIQMDFGTIIEKYLYQYQRTKSQPFTIHLQGCDPSLMKTVSVTFEGLPDSELISLLALDTASSAKGVAIGLELADGTPLAINKAAPYMQLIQGNNNLTFSAYVQAQPLASKNHALTAGDFSATANFVLAYE